MKAASLGLMVCMVATVAHGGEPIRPQIDVPLRDAAVMRGPGGVYYMTGTTATGATGLEDFDNNRGVRVWSSTDLHEWKDLGFVWDLWQDPSNNAHGRGGSAWQTELYPVPGAEPGGRDRGMTAPRLAHDGQRFWVTYSMNGYAAGAMPGCPEVEGPYTDTLLLVEAGGAPTGRSDASLFVDTDGTRYLIWGGGCIGKLRQLEDLRQLEPHETGVEGEIHYLPTLVAGYPGNDGLPDRGAPYGAFVFHDGHRYHFVFTATTVHEGQVHEDSYVCDATRLLGPYSKPQMLVPDSGRCVAFRGPDDVWQLAYSDAEDRPVIAEFAVSGLPTATGDAPQIAPPEIASHVAHREATARPPGVDHLIEMVEPCLDHPLRDAALCQGPDGTWYMVGTEASQAADGTLDWSRNRGIRLWQSADLEDWIDCGYIWDIERNARKSAKSAWQLNSHLDLTCGAVPRIGRAMTAPEMHRLDGTFWIVYSMNGSGIGILKSTTGRAEGPYEDQGRIVAHGRDPSLFEDTDGTIYLVWGPGFYARMNAALDGLDGPVNTLFTNVAWYSRYLRRPEFMGQWGSRIVKSGDWYVWSFTTRTGRCGTNAIDSVASWSKSLAGPWTEPCIVLANGGQSTLVPDGAGGWLATVSGEDEYSQCPYQPAITSVVTDGNLGSGLSLKPMGPNPGAMQFHAINSYNATALDLWNGHPDLIPHTLRDVFIMRDRDGTYYCTGSFWGVDKLRRLGVLFASTDLLHWAPLPPVYSYDRLSDDGLIDDVETFNHLIERDRAGDNWRFRIQIGEQKIWKLNDGYYMNVQAFCNPGGHFLLKSRSGKPTGPYEAIQSIVGVGDLMQDEDGSVLFNSGNWIRRFKNVAEFENTDRSDYRVGAVTIRNSERPNICFSEDCEAGIMRIHGRYVNWSTDWTGSYDAIYQYADSYEGPYKGRMRILPYGGNGKFFQNGNGDWFYGYFPNSNDYATRRQNLCRMNIYPVFVGFEDGELIIEPVALRQNRARIEEMGVLWQRPRSN